MDRAQAAQEDLADREVLEDLAGQAALEWEGQAALEWEGQAALEWEDQVGQAALEWEDQAAQALEDPAWAEGLGDHRLHQEAEAAVDAAVCHL